ncbi:hypothetical protein V3G39_04055 [Dermatophilaceae bacterium Sec6.4]
MGDVSSSWRRQRNRWAGTGAAVMAVSLCAGCSGGSAAAGHSGASSVRLVNSAAAAVVVTGATPEAESISLSRVLFVSAPVVVVAGSGDAAGIHRGAAAAVRLGVPLLVMKEKEASQSAQVAAEISRLHAGSVLAMSSAVADDLKGHTKARITTDTTALPAVSRADPTSPVAVLMGEGASPELGEAVSASARAAGATVIPVKGADLRDDPGVIKALATLGSARVVAVGKNFGSTGRLTQRVAVARTGVQLPGGGQALFPGHRLVALYGYPGTPVLGVLGAQGLDASIARVKKMAARYQRLSTVPVVPTFEIIATIADSTPGPDGNYSDESSVASLRPWVEKAGKAGLYVVLDLQPGRANLLDQAKLYAPLLKLPYVGLALDPEWKLTRTQRPLQQIGSVDASAVDAVSAWLSQLTTTEKLPQKLLVLHQFQLQMIRHEKELNLSHDNVQVLIHMDGQGTQPMKKATWKAVTNAAPKGIPFGWKNFYTKDHPMLSPEQTMAARPAPSMISYQ